ncbi:MAG TPA: hypothetical protein VL400_27800, partial [Polyangiaceae bacterium]|nr:hypothetical protein [Polyangiaceae bacterium]
MRPSALGGLTLFAVGAATLGWAAPLRAEAYAVPDGVRVRAVGSEHMAGRSSSVRLTALRGETVAFQIVYEPRGEDAPRPAEVTPMSVTLESSRGRIAGDVFVERFVDVKTRSHNDRSPGALGFTAHAAPADETSLGLVPDALLTPAQAAIFARVDAADPTYASLRRAVYYVEVFVPDDAPAGVFRGAVALVGPGGLVDQIPVALTVLDAPLPYRPVRMHAYYERATLERYFDDPDGAERDLVRTLHAHHVEAIVELSRPEHVERIRGALDGSWFDGDYRGPGRGVPASVAALGTYGTLGDPDAATLATVKDLATKIPDGVADVFVYAVDESCDSPRGPRWRAMLHDANVFPRVVAGHTCDRDPTHQDVDLAMMPAQSFDPERAAAARAQGKRVWIYNGMLPFTGASVLDVPPTSLTIDGWIAATFDVGRWFFWESVFWEDH